MIRALETKETVRQREAREAMVALLKDLLSKAEAGELQAVHAHVTFADGATGYLSAGDYRNAEAIGQLVMQAIAIANDSREEG